MRWGRADFVFTLLTIVVGLCCSTIVAEAQDCGWAGTPFTTGPEGNVSALATADLGSGEDLFAGGTFNTADGQQAANIATWDGVSWSSVGLGLNGSVSALLAYDDGGGVDLYVGGDFTATGGVPVASIARWTGSAWQAVGVGLPGGIRALTSYDDGGGADLVAGGTFTVVGGAAADYLARWDGVSWAAFPQSPNGAVHSVIEADLGAGTLLVAGGSFSMVGAGSANNIATWNGVTWQALGAGTNGLVRACAVYDSGSGPELYIGGDFTIVDGLSVNGIARWNGTSWATLGTGVAGNVHALQVHDDGVGEALFVGGDFLTASGLMTPRIACWHGSSWHGLGSGISGTAVGALAAQPSARVLWVGGTFTTAGATSVTNVAHWGGSTTPTLTTDLMDVSICENDPLTLSVEVAGGGPLSYEWRRNGQLVGTNPTFVFPLTTPGVGSWEVTVSNPCGQVTSSTATVLIEAAPDVVGLADQSVCPGDTAVFDVTVSSVGGTSIVWRHDGMVLPGETGTNLTLVGVSSLDAGTYEIEVTDQCSVTMVSATLTVYDPVQITAEPSSTTVCPDTPASFTVVATGNPLPTYQWFLDSNAIVGATSDTYSIANATIADTGTYHVDVTNACGTVTSVQALLLLHDEVQITAQPMGASLCPGTGYTLMSTATGTAPLSFQWYLDGMLLAGQDAPSLEIMSADLSVIGSYTVEVSNLCGTVVSSAANISLLTETSITQAPVGFQQCEGTAAQLEVMASGSALSYQWHKDGLPIGGAISSTLAFASLTGSEAGNYHVVVTGTCGSEASTTASVVVDLLPSVDMEPVAQTATVGESALFMVQASGLAPLSYQWLLNGVPLGGETSSTLMIDPVLSSAAGNYSVQVTNACGMTTSANALLTVNPVPGPTGISCCSDSLDVQVCWSLPLMYTSIEVRRSGVPLATLPGDTVCYAEVLPAIGSYTYEVVGTAFGEESVVAVCGLQSFGPVGNLQCGVPSPMPGLQEVLLSWNNPVPYDGFAIYRDDVLVATLPGSTSLYLDTGVPDGLTQYRVEAQLSGLGCISTSSTTCALPVNTPVVFRRGDANNDLQFNVADVIFLISYLFNAGAAPLCFDAADMNDDGFLDISDPIYKLTYIFNNGEPPPPPFTATGPDPTPDGLGCTQSAWQ